MGIGLATLWTFALLTAGTGATWWLELRLLRGQPELGPAPPLHVTPDRRTDKRDPWMYYAGPVLALMGVAWGALCIPFSETLVGADVGVGAFYFIIFSSSVSSARRAAACRIPFWSATASQPGFLIRRAFACSARRFVSPATHTYACTCA